MRARLCARLSLQRAARHPRSPHAAAPVSGCQGARGAPASGGRSCAGGRAFLPGRRRNRCADRALRDRPRRVLRCRELFRARRHRLGSAHALDRQQREQPCRSARPMRFWRRREGAEATDALADDAESLPPGEESPVDAPQLEPAPEPADSGERRGWLGRLRAGMSRSSARLTQGINTIFTRRRLDDQALLELEELLISSDMGVGVAGEVAEALRKTRFNQEVSPEEVRAALADEVIRLVEQLQIWGERTGCPVVTRPEGSDAAGLAYDALVQAQVEGSDILLIDTAGRLHNKANLMSELQKIVRVLKKVDPQAPHSVLLVLDATTGQNAHAQAEIFREMVGV